MKTIKNKKVLNTDDINNYADLIVICASGPIKGGYDEFVMAKHLRIINFAIAKRNQKSIEFEDDDFNTIKKCVKDMKWKIPHQELLDFMKYIREFDNQKQSGKKND